MTVVAIEVAALAALVATGWLLPPPEVRRGWRTAAALPLGVAALVAVELVLVVVPLPLARPWVALVVALACAVLAARRRAVHGAAAPGRTLPVLPRPWSGSGPAVPAVLIVAAVAGVVVATALVPLVNVSVDSFRYVTVGRLLAVDGDLAVLDVSVLQKRGLAIGTVHGLASSDLGYLRAFDPLLAASTLLALWMVVRDGTARLPAATSRWVAGAGVALLATNHRFLFSALYLNGHLLTATWLLLLVVVVWRLTVSLELAGDGGDGGDGALGVGAGSGSPRDAGSAALLAVGLALLRPEGPLLAGLALTPALLAPQVPRRWRRAVLVPLGLSTVLWQGPVLLRGFVGAPPSVLGMLLLGVGLLALAALLPLVDALTRWRPLVVLHGLAWVAVAGLSLRAPEILVRSLASTKENVLQQGAWGVSLVVLGTLLVVAVAARRVPGEQAWLFPLLTFAPLALLLAFLRGSGYRVGPGDSLNRMLLHVLPLAVLALVMTAGGHPRRRAWRWRDDARHDELSRSGGQ